MQNWFPAREAAVAVALAQIGAESASLSLLNCDFLLPFDDNLFLFFFLIHSFALSMVLFQHPKLASPQSHSYNLIHLAWAGGFLEKVFLLICLSFIVRLHLNDLHNKGQKIKLSCSALYFNL